MTRVGLQCHFFLNTVYIHFYTIYLPIYNAIKMYETFIVFGMVHSNRICISLATQTV